MLILNNNVYISRRVHMKLYQNDDPTILQIFEDADDKQFMGMISNFKDNY